MCGRKAFTSSAERKSHSAGEAMFLLKFRRAGAVLCSIALLGVVFAGFPFAESPLIDEFSYARTAEVFANTGHFVYNGWATAMLGWQILLAAPFVRILGAKYLYTDCRLSTLLVAALTAFLIHRVFVRCGYTENSATLCTLALVLSPLYVLLAITFHSDMYGLAAILVCLYSCVRALQTADSSAATIWILAAAFGNALMGTARQNSWLGLLVMVPSALWLLRKDRRTLLIGSGGFLLSVAIMLICLRWMAHQPYAVPEHLLPESALLGRIPRNFLEFLLDLPYLLLPLAIPFTIALLRRKPAACACLSLAAVLYIFFAPERFPRPIGLKVESGNIADPTGLYAFLKGNPSFFLPLKLQMVASAMCFVSLAWIAYVSFMRRRETDTAIPGQLTRKQVLALVSPFTVAYLAVLITRSAHGLYDRYALGLYPILIILVLPTFQRTVGSGLRASLIVGLGVFGICSACYVHNFFAFSRARISIRQEFAKMAIFAEQLDQGWDLNSEAELQNAPAVNDPGIVNPAHHHVEVPLPPTGWCSANPFFRSLTPHIKPVAGVAFSQDLCYGSVPVAPVSFVQWPLHKRIFLYGIWYAPPGSNGHPAP
jgi:hypothetical protein